MTQDLSELPDGERLTTDVCIIGAGAAGIALALELAGNPIEVLLLESGGLQPEPDTQDLYAGGVTDERLHSPPDRYRQRRFGGTTTIWGGRCMPLDPIDFEVRDYVPHSGWPISRADLDPFYLRANRLCEAGEFKYTMAEALGAAARDMIPDFNSAHFTLDSIERFSCPTDFGTRYRHRLCRAKNVRVLLHANATELRLDPTGGRIESVVVRSLQGRRCTVTAKEFVLATGGLEVVRLLLGSHDVQPQGIGNQHGLVGRYYMCHIAGTAGTLSFRPGAKIWNGYDISPEGIYCRRRIALRPEAQRSHGIGNFIARLHHPRITDPSHRNAILSLLYLAKFAIPYEYGKRLHGDEHTSPGAWLGHVRNVAVGPWDAVAFAWHMFRDRMLSERKFPSIIIRPKTNLFSVDFHAEQQPDPLSRVTLGDQVDALGQRRLLIDWRYSPGDVDTVSRSMRLLADDLEQSGVGRLGYDPAALEAEMTRYGAYGGHHIGTTRMGSTPRTGVVDAECRVHGVDNLSIVGSSVFPTSSQANPTLTVVALALRLGSRLKRLLMSRP